MRRVRYPIEDLYCTNLSDAFIASRICVDTGRACSLLLTSPLAASQNFEYKMSNILDKPLEVRCVGAELIGDRLDLILL